MDRKGKRKRGNHDEMFEAISGLVEGLQALNKEAFQAYTPIVDAIVSCGSRDVHHIEHTLDGLLSFCGYAPILQLYKKLCRHYFNINPAATAYYVNAYREMWGSEEREKQEPPVKKMNKEGRTDPGRSYFQNGNSSKRGRTPWAEVKGNRR